MVTASGWSSRRIDHDHEIKIEAFHIDQLVKKGESTTIEFKTPTQQEHFHLNAVRRMQGISLLSLLALVFAAAPLFAQAPVQSVDRAKTLGNELMCTCGCGDTADSCSHPGAAFSGPCDVAKGKLKEMNERIARGESDKTILQAFVEEYGDSALAAPPARGLNWFAYTFPAIVFAIGLVLVLMIIRQWRHRPPQLVTASGPAVTPEMLEKARGQIKREAQDY